LFVTNIVVGEAGPFDHPLLRYRAALPSEHEALLSGLKKLSFDLVIRKAEVQQLERRGQLVVEKICKALFSDPEQLIPQSSWRDFTVGSIERRVCDYVAGMTDSYAEKVYRRLFMPGYGSSTDEL
jgi:dGTPase